MPFLMGWHAAGSGSGAQIVGLSGDIPCLKLPTQRGRSYYYSFSLFSFFFFLFYAVTFSLLKFALFGRCRRRRKEGFTGRGLQRGGLKEGIKKGGLKGRDRGGSRKFSDRCSV